MRLAALALLAALPWTPTPNVSSPHLFVDEPAIAFSRDGTGLASLLRELVAEVDHAEAGVA